MNDHYTYDYIHGTTTYVYQRKDMFRINTDTSLLAAFMQIKQGERILDIGTNNGALLAVAATKQPAYLYGVEIQEAACKLAEHNLKDCGVPFTILAGDAGNMTLPKVDDVICNPPYFKVNTHANLNESDYLRIARHECYLPFPLLCKQAASTLQEKGRFYLVHRADRIGELMKELLQHRFGVRTLQFVYDQNKEEAITVLIEAIKDGGHHTHVLPPIMLKR